MTRNLRVLPYIMDNYGMGEKYYSWSCVCDSIVLKNYGARGPQPKTPAYFESMTQEFYDTTMNDEELKVMLEGVVAARSEKYDLNYFRFTYSGRKMVVVLESHRPLGPVEALGGAMRRRISPPSASTGPRFLAPGGRPHRAPAAMVRTNTEAT